MGSPTRNDMPQDKSVLKKGNERSPLSRRRSPRRGPMSPMSMSPPNITIALSPSSQQRVLFGLEPENIENSKSKSKNTKRVSIKETDARTSSVLSALFSGRSPGTSKTISSSGRRLSRRQTPLLTREDMSSVPEELQSSSPSGDVSTMKLPHGSSPRKQSNVPKLAPKKEPISPLHPPRRQSRPISDPNYANDFTLTPTILYNSSEGHYIHPMSAGGRHYHQSPHWSGQVRVNPFSPIPEQYLRPPPTSTRSVSRGSFRNPGYYKLINLEPPTLPTSLPAESKLQEPRKKTRLIPIRSTAAAADSAPSGVPTFNSEQDFFSEISPTDVAHANDAFDSMMSGNKRKAEDLLTNPPPQSLDSDEWQNDSNERKRIKRGRYLDEFQEVKFLGSGSFGSVNACLSRLDGCMYAIKKITPTGQIKNCNDSAWEEQAGIGGVDDLYGGRKLTRNQCAVPPNPRGSPSRRRKSKSRINIDGSVVADDCRDLGELQGSGLWNDGALRRMLREVFALAALCQQDDFRTFHIVRYQQAWLEDDGALYIQTELCTATLRDEMTGAVLVDDVSAMHTSQRIDVFRQLKVLREVLLALELVHQRGMVHLDIKPENIFVKNNLYKLGDFGLAHASTKIGGQDATIPDVEEGDSRYMSKDLLDSGPKDLTKCDIFSLGVTMYEICSGQRLPSCGQDWQDLRNGKLCPLPGTMPCLNAIIREMMHRDPESRPSATEILSREGLRAPEIDYAVLGTSREGSTYKVGPKVDLTRKRSASF